MWILGIETSTANGALALLQDERIASERILPRAGRRHAQTLVLEIGELLEMSALKPADLSAIAVSIGPGSFTGLRVGVVCAKTLAFVTQRPLIAVDTFLAIAEQAPAEVAEIKVIGDAQRRELFAARYVRRSACEFAPAEAIRIVSAADWLAGRKPEDVVSGPGVRVVADELAGKCRVIADADREPRAGTVARVGRRLFERGEFADPDGLEPFYLRPSAAEEKRLSAGK